MLREIYWVEKASKTGMRGITCPAVTATSPKFPLPSSRGPRSTSESISTKTIQKSKWEVAHFSNHFKKGWAFNPSTSEASLPFVQFCCDYTHSSNLLLTTVKVNLKFSCRAKTPIYATWEGPQQAEVVQLLAVQALKKSTDKWTAGPALESTLTHDSPRLSGVDKTGQVLLSINQSSPCSTGPRKQVKL